MLRSVTIRFVKISENASKDQDSLSFVDVQQVNVYNIQVRMLTIFSLSHLFTGWTGRLCDEDIDECVTSPCKNGGLCINVPATYTCACLFGNPLSEI